MLEHAVTLPQTLVSAAGRSFSCYNCWCSFPLRQIKQLLWGKITWNIIFFMTQEYLYSIWGIQKIRKIAANFEHHFSPKKLSGLSHIISHPTLFPSGYLLFFSFCCILTLLNLPLPHEISQISKESENTIAHIGQHSNQHWCFFKSFIERPFV